MSEAWNQTDNIVMAVQTAELRRPTLSLPANLFLSCSLMNIARGKCLLEVTGEETPSSIGTIHIELDRPVMHAAAKIPQNLMDQMIRALSRNSPRPISITLKVDSQLTVSIDGELRIEKEQTIDIIDISVTLPLK